MIKLQISITDEENQLLSMRASSLGYDVAKYTKFLLAREALDHFREIPAYFANTSQKSAVKEARSEYKTGKLKSWPIK